MTTVNVDMALVPKGRNHELALAVFLTAALQYPARRVAGPNYELLTHNDRGSELMVHRGLEAFSFKRGF